MSEQLLEPVAREVQPHEQGRRHHTDSEDRLILTELNPDEVIDHLGEPVDTVSSGPVREVCPKCKQSHLRLVLRQDSVRVAHLFCPVCASCFDAHYTNGAPALTI